MIETSVSKDVQLHQFNRLIQELLRGDVSRNAFQRWEVDLLLDMQRCPQKAARKRETLRRYQRAVQRHLANGGQEPFPLSEYLEGRKRKAN